MEPPKHSLEYQEDRVPKIHQKRDQENTNKNGHGYGPLKKLNSFSFKKGFKLKDRFKIQDRLSAGPFGKVYSAVDAVTGQQVVVKCSNDQKMLDLEMGIMRVLQTKNQDGFARLIESGQNQQIPYIVMNRFGTTLQDLMDSRCQFFSVKTIMQIGIQLTTLLEQFHSLGLVYNDLKPDNICVGEFNSQKNLGSNLHNIYLIDYGLATRFRTKDSIQHRSTHVQQKTEGFKGNYAYASQNALNLQTTSRRDDIISLLFLMYYLLTGGIFGRPNQACRVAILKTRQFYDEKNLTDAKELAELAQYAYSLEFKEKPNYSKIRFLLTKVLLDNNQVPSNDFDWNKYETVSTKIKDLKESGLICEYQMKKSQQSHAYGRKMIKQYKNELILKYNQSCNLVPGGEADFTDDLQELSDSIGIQVVTPSNMENQLSKKNQF